ncbi:MAG: hypothetical protein AAGF85_08820 [Bacteroidota bacterium]
MTDFEKKKLEFDFFGFIKKNFVKPRQCKNIDELRFYIKELSDKIEEMKMNHGYVPDSAYQLLADYNRLQNKILFTEFKNTYH